MAEYRDSSDETSGGCLSSLADVLVAMSGGVDSTVAALALYNQGFRLLGVTMKLFDDELIGTEEVSGCCSLDDVEDARNACRKMGIRHITINFKDRFQRYVVDRFCSSYLRGETPNPCIDCNRHIKFDALQQKRKELGAEYVATGHYARRRFDKATGKWQLLRGIDLKKDQSYVLYHLTQDDLAHMLFPLGDLTKQQVRDEARANGLDNAEKRESQDICFVPEGAYQDFIVRYKALGPDHPFLQEGDIVDREGARLGAHKGLVNYTIGQRKGIGVAAREPLYVWDKDVASNQLVVAPKSCLSVGRVELRDVNIISGETPRGAQRVSVKTGYRQKPTHARAVFRGGSAYVRFDSPIMRPSPGQSAVIYDGDVVIGGGIIDSSGD